MITISDRQTWVCLRTKRRGRMITITGLHSVVGDIATLTYASIITSRRSTGKITANELRRNWRLVFCPHKDSADDCTICACAFHGTDGCTCVAKARDGQR